MTASEPYPCTPSAPAERSLMHWLKMARSCIQCSVKGGKAEGHAPCSSQGNGPINAGHEYRVLGQRLENAVWFGPPFCRDEITSLRHAGRRSACAGQLTASKNRRHWEHFEVPRGQYRQPCRFCRARRPDTRRLPRSESALFASDNDHLMSRGQGQRVGRPHILRGPQWRRSRRHRAR